MSLPGLNASTPVEEDLPSEIHEIKEQAEWRFEVAFGNKVEVKLLSGSAEIFGTELAIKQPYTFIGTKAAIYTWHGCRIEVTGECQVEYIAEETPIISYTNLHFALEKSRDLAFSSMKDGPKVLIVGSENSGKTSMAKFLTAYAVRSGRQPVAVNLDTRESMLSIPGTLSATTFSSILDVEEGWGSSPTNGPTPVPVKLPLVYYLGLENPEENRDSFKPVASRLALSVNNRLQDDAHARAAGCIIDTPGVMSQGKSNYELLQHVISDFSGKNQTSIVSASDLTNHVVNVIIVLGSERLYSDLNRRFNGKSLSPGDSTVVIKLDKSGGCVDRDDSFRHQLREAQIREYFFGDPKNTLSPHTQQIDFSQLTIYRIPDASTDFSNSLLPGDYDADERPVQSVFEKVTSPTPQMQNAILAIMHAETFDAQESIRDASVVGFIYVAEMDEKRKKLKILAPVSGRLPGKAIIWGKWPEGSEKLVG